MIFYKHWQPIARCLYTPSGDPVIFLKQDEWFGGSNSTHATRVIRVPDIGMIFPKISMPDEQFFEHARQQLTNMAYFYVERAKKLRPRTVAMGHSYGSGYYPAWQVTRWRSCIEDAYRDYNLIGGQFKLDWPPYPSHMLNEYDAAIQRKHQQYHSPSAVKKRDRVQARLDAVRALTMGAAS
jgi:hypothetical protein